MVAFGFGMSGCCCSSIIKLDSSGNVVWQINTGDTVDTVRVGESGRIYALSALTTIIRKFNSNDASSVWNVTDTTIPNSRMRVSAADSLIYHGTLVTNDFVLARNLSGATVWTSDKSFTAPATGLACNSGNVWFGRDTSNRIRKPAVATGVDAWNAVTPAPTGGTILYPSSDGTSIWEYHSSGTGTILTKWNSAGTMTGGTVFFAFTSLTPADMAIDSSENIILCGHAGATQKVESRTAAAALNWSFTVSNQPTAVAVDSSRNVYVTEGGTVHKLNSSGVEQWNYVHVNDTSGRTLKCVDVDSSGNVYVCGDVA